MALDPEDGWNLVSELSLSATDPTNLLMHLIVYSGSGTNNPANSKIYCDGKCLNFPNDIRFGTTNDPATAEQLKQWIEYYDDEKASIWIRLPAASTSTIYMFIRNASAGFYSDTTTWDFFDHFTTIDENVWEEVDSDNTCSYSISGGTYLQLTMDNSTSEYFQHHGLKTVDTIISSQEFIALTRCSADSGQGGIWRIGWLSAYNSWDNDDHFQVVYDSDIDVWTIEDYAGGSSLGPDSNPTDWRLVALYRKTDNYPRGAVYSDYFGGNKICSGYLNETWPSSEHLGLFVSQEFASGISVYYDWVAYGKYSADASWTNFGSWTSLPLSFHINSLLSKVTNVNHHFNTKLTLERLRCLYLSTRLTLPAQNLKIYNDSFSDYYYCSRWDEDNWRIIVEIIATKEGRDNLRNNITPGAVAELYNILGQPKFIDTTYSSGNTITLAPVQGRNLATLRNATTVAVKSYSETMLRWDMFRIKLECVKL